MALPVKQWVVGFLIVIFFSALSLLIFLNLPDNSMPPPKSEPNQALLACAQTAEVNAASASFTDIAQTRQAILQGNFEQAGQKIAQVYQHSKIACWSFVPFVPYMKAVFSSNADALWSQLNRWIEQQPQSVEAHLARASYTYFYYWTARGHQFFGPMARDGQASARDWLNRAQKDWQWLSENVPDNPFVVFYSLQTHYLSGASKPWQNDFRHKITQFPEYTALYKLQLLYLMPRWGGSIAEMKAFDQRYIQRAEQGSALSLFSFRLFMLVTSELADYCKRFPEKNRRECYREAFRSVDGDVMKQKAIDVIENLADVNNQEANQEIAKNLDEMPVFYQAADWYQDVLNAFASRVGKPVKLSQKQAEDNYYLINSSLGTYWIKRNEPERALLFLEKAYQAIDYAQFLSEAQKKRAQIDVINKQLQAHSDLRKYTEIVPFRERLEALTEGHAAMVENAKLICEAYYELEQYQQALEFCTAVDQASLGEYARYYLAKTHFAQKQYDLAAKNFETALYGNMPYSFKRDVLISLPLSYEQTEGKAKALALMNAFEEKILGRRSPEKYKAVFYNNRCYFKMELGQFQAALDDCNHSLNYDTLQIAVDKQKQLNKMLGKSN